MLVKDNSEVGFLWDSLTEEQKNELLEAYVDSEDDANLRDDKDVWLSC